MADMTCAICHRPLAETTGICSRTEVTKRKQGVDVVEIVWRYCRAEKPPRPVDPQQPLF